MRELCPRWNAGNDPVRVVGRPFEFSCEPLQMRLRGSEFGSSFGEIRHSSLDLYAPLVKAADVVVPREQRLVVREGGPFAVKRINLFHHRRETGGGLVVIVQGAFQDPGSIFRKRYHHPKGLDRSIQLRPCADVATDAPDAGELPRFRGFRLDV